MNALGTHLLLDLRQCNPDLLNDLQYINQAMMRAAPAVLISACLCLGLAVDTVRARQDQRAPDARAAALV